MNGFQAVAGTATVPESVVAESRPGVNSSQQVECLGRDIRLVRLERPVDIWIRRLEQIPTLVMCYLIKLWTLSCASEPSVVGCLSVVAQLSYGSGKLASIGWKR